MNKTIITAAAAAALVLGVAACSHAPSALQQEQAAQSADTTSLVNDQPIPHYNWSQYRATLIDAENIAASGTQTTSFFFNQGGRDPVFTCPSIGMPVPNTAQLSNPAQVVPVTGRWGGGHDILPQMDPFGAYTPSASTGTYVICVNASGKPYMDYWEGFVQAVNAPATWDYGTHTLKVTGAPTSVIHTKSNK